MGMRRRKQRDAESLAARCIVLVDICLEVRFEGVQKGFLSERKKKVIPCRKAEDRKGTGSCQREIPANSLLLKYQKCC